MLVFREHERLTHLGEEDQAKLKEFALANQTDQQGKYRPVLSITNGLLQARNYVRSHRNPTGHGAGDFAEGGFRGQ